ncbi:MAG: hypothetical protein IV092_02025 [Burkholderiaceae bacterium]|nr:hypothetical protein [Burkholderiaceae bacterium]
MRKSALSCTLALAMAGWAGLADAGNRPFPQNASYANFLKANHPNSNTNALRAADIKAYYNQWKTDYLKLVTTQQGTAIAYVAGPATGSVPDSWPDGSKIVSASEHTGYGMLLTVLMDGVNGANSEKDEFDKLLKTHQKIRTSTNANSKLMSWAIGMNADDKIDESLRDSSATDGDMDIALALLMADKQWGSGGANPNYLQIAKDLISSIAAFTVSRDAFGQRLNLGDWTPALNSNDLEDWYGDSNCDGDKSDTFKGLIYHSSRPSDWMMGHFAVFQKRLPSDFFVAGPGYSLQNMSSLNSAMRTEIHRMYDSYLHKPADGWDKGLVPDFVLPKVNGNGAQVDNKIIRPACDLFLGEPFKTSMYSENSARVPWRITSDAVVSGSTKSRDWARRLAAFSMSKAKNGAAYQWTRIGSTYKLNGDVQTAAHGKHFASMFITSLMTAKGAANQAEAQKALDAGWAWMKTNREGPGGNDGYFKDSLTLFSMLLTSQNVWWE